MTAVGSQSAKKRKKSVVVELGDESDDEIVVVAEKRPPSQPYVERFDLYDPEHNAESYYAQNELPEFHTRNLERRISKEKAWLKPLPETSKLFFAACIPTKVEDLAINPKIVGKLKLLITSNVMCGKIIFVTGPAGSGKSTAVDVIARSLNFDILKWERDLQFEVKDTSGSSYLKEVGKLRSNYRQFYSTHFQGEDVVEFRRQIYPHLRNRESKDFIVFDLTSRDSSWLMSPRRIFTKSFIRDLDIAEVEFYPVASTFMRKGLRRTIDSLGFRSRLSAQDYKAVEKLANGPFWFA
ncbi:hypothetical protein OESDEN_03172 [Oesophagostomum dentatum]|uniref:Uncharacterized protein n=1 Tax=Oesophagostomum dentatum TaxID=61180 RepID=A0A0B1TM01_OESDE|nr:hypothetical protein OESDEN_03172 [Oesophagostomum dentatum]